MHQCYYASINTNKSTGFTKHGSSLIHLFVIIETYIDHTRSINPHVLIITEQEQLHHSSYRTATELQSQIILRSDRRKRVLYDFTDNSSSV